MFDEADLLSDLDQLRSRYDILRQLGVDGGVPVYAARLPGTDRHFALKVMADRARRGASAGALHGWQAHNIEPLSHPKLMAMHAVHHLQGGAVAVAVERRRGGSLAERLREQERLNAEEIEAILRDIGEALAYLHGRGVVHRGVRPESIFLDRDAGCARLAHFGLEVEALAGTTAPGALATTEALGMARALRYFAPEQLKDGAAADGPRVSPAADLFSLGVTGWELLTGRHPQESEGSDNWRKRLAGRLADLCPEAPAPLLAALDGCLEAKPGRRVATGTEFLALLDYDDAIDGAHHPDRRRGESRDPVVAPGRPPHPAIGSRSSGRSGTRKVVAGLSKLVFHARDTGQLHLAGALTAAAEHHSDESDAPAAATGSVAVGRGPLKTFALPAVSILAVASTLAALHLHSAESSAGAGDRRVQPSMHPDLAEMEDAAIAEGSGIGADLEILEKSGASSYRVRLKSDVPSRATAKPAPSRTASRQRSPASNEQNARSSDIPTNRLQSQSGVSAGFVLLGEPVRR